MGIKGLLPFLKSKMILPQHLPAISTVVAAIDVPIFAHKFIYTERTYEGLEQRFIKFGTELKLRNFEPIFVFDGGKLDLKAPERQKRAVARDRQAVLGAQKKSAQVEAMLSLGICIKRSFSQVGASDEDNPEIPEYFEGILKPTSKDYDALYDTLTKLGYNCRKAQFEAEALCAHLVSTSQAWCAITEDTDAIAFGSTRTIYKLFQEPIMVNLDDVLTSLQLTQEQFVDLCCMLGCDFCDNVYKIGPETAYKLMLTYGSWSSIYSEMRSKWPPETRNSADAFNERYVSAKNCFVTRANEKVIVHDYMI